MKSPIVVDSTCLIGLERIGRLELLPKLYEPIVISPEVEREFGVSIPWLIIEKPSDRELINSMELVIDRGEAETIALAYEKSSQVLLDEKLARSVAKQLGLSIIGTLRMLVLAKQQSIISAVKPLLHDLEANNFRMSNELRAEVLRLANE